MSRGYPKSSFKARESSRVRARDLIDKRMDEGELNKVSELMAKDEKVRETFAELSHVTHRQLFGGFSTSQDNKRNKLRMVELVESLPKEIKDLVTLPPEAMKTLLRGVRSKLDIKGWGSRVPRIPSADPGVEGWKEGSFVYSFTGKPEKAAAFAGFDRNEENDYIMSDAHIESFKGIINPYRIADIVNHYVYSPKPGQPPLPGKWAAVPVSEDLRLENEAIVYGIKFKPDAFKKPTAPKK